ncbi:MAG: putative toxin-antitoxin system toxin component, PIN family [Candidatus Pacearchaeota archaeon]|jgi:hypothetical protein
MRVVLDTNVLVSGTFWTGVSFKILKMIDSGKFSLILSPEIINEYYETINFDEIIEKVNMKNLIANEIVQKVISNSMIVKSLQKLDIVKEDSDDNIILECAVEGNAEYILSYDRHLLNLKEFNNIKILAPEEFLNIAEEK